MDPGQGIERRPLVAVIGDGTAARGTPTSDLAEEVGRALVDAGCRVLTGGLGGVMAAALSGARSSAAWRSGDTVGVLPGHDPAAANPDVDIAIATGMGHARNLLCAQADAVIAVGGGAGTLSEMAFAWIHGRPIAALRIGGWSARLADQPIDDRRDDVVMGADTAAEAVAAITEALTRRRS